ncbi:MAG: hypothetical protein LHW56_03120 [Candidatus Cloacimonetes bacterium]|nr:hypothetical protein [Candidatus Cloacimonadota bacterium]MDY0171881.1 hypothetical protein [Candidatus Cloacimonadaceae bacterium]
MIQEAELKARVNRVCLTLFKAILQVGIYLVGFMYPDKAGAHATHGSTPLLFIGFNAIHITNSAG